MALQEKTFAKRDALTVTHFPRLTLILLLTVVVTASDVSLPPTVVITTAKENQVPRPKQDELGGMSGPGVETAIHKDINRLADKLEDLLEQRSELSEQVTKTRANLIDKMKEKQLTKYRYRDHLVEYKPGKDKVSIKTIRGDVTSQEGNGAVESEQEPE